MFRLVSGEPKNQPTIAGSTNPKNTIKAIKPSVAFHQSWGKNTSFIKCLVFIEISS